MSSESPLSDASTSEINTLVDEVLRSGKHQVVADRPATTDHDPEDRLHARVIAGQMQRLSVNASGKEDGPDDVDEWWFELDEKRIGPISVRKARFLWEEGELTPDSLCWHEGFSSWASLFKVSELAEALAPRIGGGVKVASRVELPREETSWQPNAGAVLESDNRRRLKEAHPFGLSDEREAANDDCDRSVDSYVGTHTTLPALPTPVAAAPRVGFAHSLVSGLVGGLVVAAAVIGARVFWPAPAPQEPVVVVVRDEPKPEPPKLARATPPREEAKKPEPIRTAKPTAQKSLTKLESRPPPPAPASAPAAAAAPKPETVDEQFAKAFTPPDELDTSEIFEVVASHKAQVDACVQAQKTAAPELSGRVVMRWNVALDGSVSDVRGPSGDFADAPITACLAKAIAGWKFPKHEVAHGPVDVPFVF